VVTRLEFFGDELERIRIMDPLTGEVIREQDRVTFFPASHFVSSQQTIDRALKTDRTGAGGTTRVLQQREQLLERSAWSSAPSTIWR